jgi:glycosyltransferase involved in cell wall biosynthesis
MPTQTGIPSPVRRIAIIAPDGASLLRQRAELIDGILARRHGVLAMVPETAAAAMPSLNQRGLDVATYPMASDAPQLLADGRTVKAIAAMLAEWRAHVTLSYGAKPMLLGAVAARQAGVAHRVGLVTALPPAMMADPSAAPSWGWSRVLRSGCKALQALVFHNTEHHTRLQVLGLLRKDLATRVVPGAGVDLDRHALQPLPPTPPEAPAALNFVMIARKDAAKGTLEFCRAARRVRAQAPDTRFLLAGPDGDVAPATLAGFAESVEFLGDSDDVRPMLGAAHVVVVPSWGEGLPRVLLEALAAGRPVIASAIAGCREAIDERVNGVLVPPRDAKALAEAMMSFVARPDLNDAMARASRSKAERRFDVRDVNSALMDTLGI